MNSFLAILPVLAVVAAETVLQQHDGAGGWILQINSDGQQYYQQPIPVQQSQPIYIADEPAIPAPKKFIPILSQSEVHNPDGSYQLNYLSADGKAYNEAGSLKRNFENNGNVVVKSGRYAYTAPDGTPIALNWVADEYGYRATGDHLPKNAY